MQCFISTIPLLGNVPTKDHERIALKNADGLVIDRANELFFAESKYHNSIKTDTLEIINSYDESIELVNFF